MSKTESKSSDTSEFVNFLGVIAAIICAFLGYSKGDWIGALIAAGVGYGGVWLAFHVINLALRVAILGVILAIMALALKNRWDWIVSLTQ